jgi:hypothetical protein
MSTATLPKIRIRILLSAAILATALALAAAHTGSAPNGASNARRHYGTAVRVGGGYARAYVTYEAGDSGAPVEIGVALDERALEDLPARNPHAPQTSPDGHEHVDNHPYLLSLPERGVAPYRFVELDWNPGGHEPPGIYDTPHFDFHFYTVPEAERAAIVPSDPRFQEKADLLPPEQERPDSYVVAAPPGAPAPGVPLMGVHWVDVNSPELQGMFGKPEAYRPFTRTFIYGSWNGRFHFLEPMITRAHLLAKKAAVDPAERDEVIAVPTASSYSTPGYYPGAYRITWDDDAKEYRVALTKLVQRE